MKDLEMVWAIAGVVLLLTAGFAKLASVILNRLLANPHSKKLIRPIERTQFFLIPVYGWVVTGRLRNIGPQLLNSAPIFETATTTDLFLVAIGVLGFLMLVVSTIAYQRYRPPKCQITDHSQTIDFRKPRDGQRWQDKLIGAGPLRRVALLPGNQQFTVEVSTKTYVLPRLPVEWDGLSIVHLADSHFRGAVSQTYFQLVCEQAKALQPDMVIFTGDLLDKIALLNWLPQTFGSLKAPLGQYFILGNHDWYLDPPAIKREFERCGWIDLASRSQEIVSPKSGPPILIAGDETPWMGTHPVMPAKSKYPFQILLSHTPDNIEWARDHHFDIVFAGHTHGGQIRLPLLGPVYSPSLYGCRFASGVFWLDPTLMYVSRGLSGKEPIRYNCAPELTKIILRTKNSTSS